MLKISQLFPRMPEYSPEQKSDSEQLARITIQGLNKVIELLSSGDVENYSAAYIKAKSVMKNLEELNELFPSKWKRISD